MQCIQFLIALLVFCISSLATQGQSCSVMSLGRAANLNGFVPFPADNAWNQDISSAPVDPNSSAIINFIGTSTPLHPDFGAGLYGGQTIGIPYIVVSGSPFVNVKYTPTATKAIPDRCRYRKMLPSKAIRSQATATATCWSSIATIAGSMNSTTRICRKTGVGREHTEAGSRVGL